MSSMCPQLGMCAGDRRLCPVSDWGLGLVTGLHFYRLTPPPPAPPPPPLNHYAHTPSPSARWGCRLVQVRGCGGRDERDWSGAWIAQWIASRDGEHTNTLRATRAHTHRSSSSLGVPWTVTSLLCWQPQPGPICPGVPLDFQQRVEMHELK